MVDPIAALEGWTAGEGPLFARLAAAIRGAIERGELPRGSRLPAERDLARLLSVSRGTVVAAYEELRRDGWIGSRRGSGTWVRGVGRPSAPEVPVGRSGAALRGLVEGPGDAIEFTVAALGGEEALDEILDGEPAASVLADLRAASAHHGYHTLGLPELRAAVARHLSGWGLPTAPEQVLITTGGQQAIALAAAAYVRPGDRVVVEDPTYVSAIDVLEATGGRLVGVPVGPEGVRVDVLREVVAAGASLVYLVPTFHNPTGSLLPEAKRREVAAMAEEFNVPVVDDVTLADIVLERHPPPPLAAFAPDAPILTIGSFSKLFWGGLRVGWIRAAEPTIARLVRLKLVADHGSSLPGQLLALRLLERVDRIRPIRLALVRERYRLLTELLREHLPTWSWTPPVGGLCLWVRLPGGDARDLARVARRHGVLVAPGSLASVSGAFSDHLRIPFVLEPGTMREGVRRLAAAFAGWAEEGSGPGAGVGVVV
ncbi:MAG TPA: PLP-dependent aminotransferase family protein [Actinomycetota bacterium]|nr:PLP-dependent aminotransferase family protein [Actinomycetota bacterium]